MRYINKQGAGNYQLNRAHSNPPTNATEAKTRWNSFRPHKNLTNSELLEEQYALCAYSEIRPDLEEIGTHIEHVKPKSIFPNQTFDYHNLVVSALHSDDLQFLRDEIFGGHAKRSEYNTALFKSCLSADCAQYFSYLSDGRVVPCIELSQINRGQALYTIDLLNLNSPYLINRRKKWLNELDDLYQNHISNNNSLYHLACIDLIPTNQKLSPFFTATRQFFKSIAEQVLTDHAPGLV